MLSLRQSLLEINLNHYIHDIRNMKEDTLNVFHGIKPSRNASQTDANLNRAWHEIST